jgi:hypothetical protein
MTSVYRLVALLPIALALIAPSISAQEFTIPSVTISGGDLTGSLRLAPADADMFRRRVVQPPRLEDPPAVSGLPYLVTSDYWASAVRLEDDEEAEDVGDEGHYYPDGGFVRVDLGGDDVWLVLDLRQRSILDRYIRLREQGLIGDTPSTLEVLAEAFNMETMAVEAGAELVEPEVAAGLLSDLVEANPEPGVEPRQPPSPSDDGFWLTVMQVQGGVLRYFYDGRTLTESLGTERYDATSVAGTLDGLAPASTPAIQNEDPAGSLLWWPVMIGGGIAALGAALWLRRRWVF